MIRLRAKSRLVSVALLTALLLLAHVSVAVHAFEHQIGAAHAKACSVCVTAAQLQAASVPDLPINDFRPSFAAFEITIYPSRESRPVFTARQRSPPTSP